MADIKLTSDESQVLQAALAPLVVKSRTGELGILHGMNRFVSSQVILKKKDLEILDFLARKIGLGGIKRTDL